MRYLPEVNRAKRVKGYVIAIAFNDGTEKHVDISQWFKGPVFKALKDPKFFAKFFLECGTLAWPNGVDIAPEALYDAVDARTTNKLIFVTQTTTSPREKSQTRNPQDRSKLRFRKSYLIQVCESGADGRSRFQ